MPARKKYYYYRLYDDKEQFNHIKSSIEEKAMRRLLKKFEKTHQQYYNSEFLKVLKQYDPRAELIEVQSISY